jgi:hypothetical protein
LNVSPLLSAPPDRGTVCCDLIGHGVVRLSAEEMPPLRQKASPPVGEPVPLSFLKHADEQTVAGLFAVYQAIENFNLHHVTFADWGVLGAPRFLGRASLAHALQRFADEGAWGLSPHLVPHRSLHALSGTVSQALKIHGPNFGVSGGPSAVAEGLLATAALLVGDRLPGVWLVMTGWEREPVLELESGPNPTKNCKPPICCGIALALTAAHADSKNRRLDLTAAPVGLRGYATRDFLTLESLAQTLIAGRANDEAWRLRCGGWLALHHGAGTENRS